MRQNQGDYTPLTHIYIHNKPLLIWGFTFHESPKILNGKLLKQTSWVLNCIIFWVVWCNLMLSSSVPPRYELSLCPAYSIHKSLSSHLNDQIHCQRITMLVFNAYFTWQWPQSERVVDTRDLDVLERSCKLLPLSGKVNILNKGRKKIRCWGC